MKIKKKFYSGEKYKHALELLIEKGYAVRDPNNPIDWGDGSGFRILYKNFKFEDVNLFITFMNRLKEEGCFSDFTNNPYRPAGMEEYCFKQVDIPRLERFLEANYNNVGSTAPIEGQLFINNTTGKVLYVDNTGKDFKYSFKPNGLSYTLIAFLLSNKGALCSAKAINEKLPPTRSDADFTLPERRVSSAISYIYSCLKIKETKNRFIKRKNNSYGIFCSITYE